MAKRVFSTATARLFLFAALVVFLGLAAQASPALESQRMSDQRLPACGDAMEFFTAALIDPAALSAIIPLGNLNPPAHTFPTTHTYLHGRATCFGEPARVVQVYAPGRMWLTKVKRYENSNLPEGTYDYSVDFSVCQDVEGYFIHLAGLSDDILAQVDFSQASCQTYETGGIIYTNCEVETFIELGPGQHLGWVGATERDFSFDFGLRDFRLPEAVFANQERIRSSMPSLAYAACPYDYFTEYLKEAYKALLGGFCGDPIRTDEEACGKVAWDVAGTAQGIWISAVADSLGPEDPNLALVYHNFYNGVPVFSVGDSVPGLNSGVYAFQPQTEGLVNRPFSQITPDGWTYCYQVSSDVSQPGQVDQTILLMMTDEATLLLGPGDAAECGLGSYSLSPGGYNTFIR